MKRLWFIIVLWISKFSLVLCKIFKKQGSAISGKIAQTLQKDFLRYFYNIDYTKVLLITGTNGKSCTNNLVSHIFEVAKKDIATNKEGANDYSGVISVVIKNSNLFGKFKREFLILEVDERYSTHIVKYLPAKNLCITNLMKDQVQRNGDPDFIYDMVKNSLTKNVKIFVNNEEPRSRSLEDFVDNKVYYSMVKNQESFEKNDFYDITNPCPKCGHRLNYEYYNVDNIGKFSCSNCSYKSLDKTDILIKDIDYKNKTFKADEKEYKLNYMTPFHIYNHALALSICKEFSIEYKDIYKAFETFINPLDRILEFEYKNKNIHYLRIKQENPETLQNCLDIVSRDKNDKVVYIGLYEVKDFPPKYTNTFYFFDCDLKKIEHEKIERYICFSASVCYDTANRLVYEKIDKEKIDVYDIEDDFEKIFENLEKFNSKNIYIITGMKPYEKIKKYFGK